MNANSSAPSSTTKRLQGKVALITGGASGIGKSSARLFVKQGAKVVIADVQDELGHSFCKEIGSEEIVSYVHCDVTCDSDVQNAVDLTVSKHGKLDIMFSNAGISGNLDPRILATDNEDFKRVFDVNAPHPYTVSKHALVGLAKSLCVELGQYGIRVNCISPFAIVTPMLKKYKGLMEMEKEKIQEAVSTAGNLKDVVLEEEDIAEAAVYLGSDESKYVSGINLMVDGGFSLTNPSFAMAMKSLLS
ncbi:hypothetical protein GH714_037833 [Hevea brasiliensis]|uniref:Secoisolariciresinol dehydrogenase-like n=1 Tax=Hevea brasiliensis TaxID=3981 RepID=A0A6A6KQF4_HEVBR|nr:hypothetical protein GH714_037833 [Hevea brasiliensis]